MAREEAEVQENVDQVGEDGSVPQIHTEEVEGDAEQDVASADGTTNR